VSDISLRERLSGQLNVACQLTLSYTGQPSPALLAHQYRMHQPPRHEELLIERLIHYFQKRNWSLGWRFGEVDAEYCIGAVLTPPMPAAVHVSHLTRVNGGLFRWTGEDQACPAVPSWVKQVLSHSFFVLFTRKSCCLPAPPPQSLYC